VLHPVRGCLVETATVIEAADEPAPMNPIIRIQTLVGQKSLPDIPAMTTRILRDEPNDELDIVSTLRYFLSFLMNPL